MEEESRARSEVILCASIEVVGREAAKVVSQGTVEEEGFVFEGVDVPVEEECARGKDWDA